MGNEQLWAKALQRSEQAASSGALIPLGTTRIQLSGPQADQFELRQLNASLPKHHRPEGPRPNPFRPWDPQLELECIDRDHVLILNKYPVQRGHMLLITRQWASQEHWITPADWNALVCVDRDSTGLWFFNSGPRAGASQPHRHLQLLPRHLEQECCPRLEWFSARLAKPPQRSTTTLEPLVSSCAIGKRPYAADPQEDALLLHSLYRHLAQELNLGDGDVQHAPLAPYNLLLTRSWMALIRREHEEACGFSINALGFAGYLLATEHSDVPWLTTHGPEELLRQVVPPRFREATDVMP